VRRIIDTGITLRKQNPVGASALRDTQFYTQIRDLGRIGEGRKIGG
jgi:hypothetical protein